VLFLFSAVARAVGYCYYTISAGKRQVLVEVWDWDFWRPDELLGRGFVDINALAFEPQEVR
jgi:hypothetical protein